MTPLNVAAIVYAVVAFLSMCAVFLFILGIMAVADASLIEKDLTVDTGQNLVVIIGAFFIALVLSALWPVSTVGVSIAALKTHWREKKEAIHE